jgi:hypothetical protein
MACTEKLYIQSASSLKEKIDRYDQIITALEDQMLNNAAGNSDLLEYQLDDGHVKIKEAYRDPSAIAKAIDNYTFLRNRCYNELNGRVFTFRDKRGMI